MPWQASDAIEHTHKASTPALQKMWAEIANDALARGNTEAQAIRQANAVVAKEHDKRVKVI